jgi:hypothetical protein
LSKGPLERDSDKKRPEESVNAAESYARQTGSARGIFEYGSATASWELLAIWTLRPPSEVTAHIIARYPPGAGWRRVKHSARPLRAGRSLLSHLLR